jgi:RNA polymerase sigma-B factor
MTEGEIVRANEGLAHLLTRRYSQREDYDDILQEARLGILIAARKYDPQRAAFSTYAAQWIRSRVARHFKNIERHVLFTVSLDAPTTSEDGEGPALIETIIDDRDDAYARADAAIVAEMALAQMRPFAATTLRMRGEGRTLQDIADRLGRSRQWINETMRRAREKIARRIGA